MTADFALNNLAGLVSDLREVVDAWADAVVAHAYVRAGALSKQGVATAEELLAFTVSLPAAVRAKLIKLPEFADLCRDLRRSLAYLRDMK
jgi:hypothetical protein